MRLLACRLGGIATSFGVESTARDAWHGNYAFAGKPRPNR